MRIACAIIFTICACATIVPVGVPMQWGASGTGGQEQIICAVAEVAACGVFLIAAALALIKETKLPRLRPVFCGIVTLIAICLSLFGMRSDAYSAFYSNCFIIVGLVYYLCAYLSVILVPKGREILQWAMVSCFVINSLHFLVVWSFAQSAYPGYALLDVYKVLLTLPWILRVNRHWITLLAIAVSVSLAFLSYKRGAVVVVSIFTMVWLVALIIGGGKRERVVALVAVGLIAAAGTSFLANEELVTRLMEKFGDPTGSGRVGIYDEMLTLIGRMEPGEWLFGIGGRDNNVPAGGSHNDFLYLLYYFGLVGCVSYLSIIIASTIGFVAHSRIDLKNALFAAAVASTFLCLSSFSTLIDVPYFKLMTVSLGFLAANGPDAELVSRRRAIVNTKRSRNGVDGARIG